ncbi:uncharacterized protein LOC111700393 [Eurytemora carolleeae]|uniref:uncharacterized protein LOC111700393 n=1 Tax=Eurytemora carolleeae TaxID=1294199 RepID=UPI000C76523F|nr:uncharacterized protein LOC111700393 [Eurytemora carolleeae]|eukprot:XP_023327046.1 uncharacterized protein LOC111700393 [Eurytemora affinis]
MAEKVGGGTPYAEAVLEERRRVIRNALKHEFIQKRYHPKAAEHGGVVFDAALQRWNALQFSYGEHFKPSIRNFAKFFSISILPIATFYYFTFGPRKQEWLKSISQGEVPIDHPTRKAVYITWL